MNNVTLREYVDQRFLDNGKAVEAALQAAEKAVEKAERNAEKWRENANEWRGAMNDKDKAFALKTETERLEADVKKLQLWEAKLSGMATQKDLGDAKKESNNAKWIAIISAGTGIVATIISLFK